MTGGSKIKTLDELIALRADWTREGRTVVWTNGCFDLLHVGHIRSFRDAKHLGDILVVGINSDAGVRAIKGNSRPIVGQQDRAEIIAALEMVDYVTIFDETDPCTALARLRPDIHCKGAEYAGGARPVPEREIVLGYGGQIRFLPFHPGRSTTGLIEQLRRTMTRALFLDRDGTIIEDPGYLKDPAHVRVVAGAVEALRALAAQGWKLIVVSNQSGVGRGMIRPDQMEAVQDRFLELMRSRGVPIAGSWFCKHAPEEGCECRKPSAFLLRQAAREYGLDLGSCWMIGDRETDILTGKNAGCSTIWLRNSAWPVHDDLPDFIANDWDDVRRRLSE